jgi:3-deoxy-D-manno-octulosonic-acid transferase
VAIISILYDTLLLLAALLYLPYNAFQILVQKKAKRWIFTRLKTPKVAFGNKEVIWLHAVSLGETKALLNLLDEIKRDRPHVAIFVTVMTVTAFKEAKKRGHLIDQLSYLPLDLSWIMRKITKQINLKLLILVEGDFWFHMAMFAKQRGARVVVASGCISEKSANSFARFSFLTRHLFSQIDLYGVQAAHYVERFMRLGIDKKKIKVTGNIKLSSAVKKVNDQVHFPVDAQREVITIGCTHPGEEEALFKALKPLMEQRPLLTLAFAPRHLDRTPYVIKAFESLGVQVQTLADAKKDSRVILIDAMGVLDAWYSRSKLAILGGSFVPGIGGHNIIEPIFYDCPPLFGPFMHSQLDLVTQIQTFKAGQTTSLETISRDVQELLENAKKRLALIEGGRCLLEAAQKSSKQTWNYIYTGK